MNILVAIDASTATPVILKEICRRNWGKEFAVRLLYVQHSGSFTSDFVDVESYVEAEYEALTMAEMEDVHDITAISGAEAFLAALPADRWALVTSAPRNLAFFAGNFDVGSPYGVTPPTLKDFKEQAPQAVCKLMSTNVQRNVLVNREALPFNKPELRRAVALTIDRKAFIDTLTQGAGSIGGALLALGASRAG